MLTAVHKHYTIAQWQDFFASAPANIEDHIMVSSGTSESDFEKMSEILSLNDKLRFICIDVANGYSEHFVSIRHPGTPEFSR